MQAATEALAHAPRHPLSPGPPGAFSHTAQDGSVGGQETVLQSLLVVARLERILLRDDTVDVLAGVYGDVAAAVAIEDAEEGELARVLLGSLGVVFEQIQHCGVGIFHAYAPALHGRQAVDEPLIPAMR